MTIPLEGLPCYHSLEPSHSHKNMICQGAYISGISSTFVYVWLGKKTMQKHKLHKLELDDREGDTFGRDSETAMRLWSPNQFTKIGDENPRIWLYQFLYQFSANIAEVEKKHKIILRYFGIFQSSALASSHLGRNSIMLTSWGQQNPGILSTKRD